MGFNQEVAEDGALYWKKTAGDLAGLLNRADAMQPGEISALGQKAKQRIRSAYSSKFICGRYAEVLLNCDKA